VTMRMMLSEVSQLVARAVRLNAIDSQNAHVLTLSRAHVSSLTAVAEVYTAATFYRCQRPISRAYICHRLIASERK